MRKTVLRESAHDSDSKTFLIVAEQGTSFYANAPSL